MINRKDKQMMRRVSKNQETTFKRKKIKDIWEYENDSANT
jgi:hypothetical protein